MVDTKERISQHRFKLSILLASLLLIVIGLVYFLSSQTDGGLFWLGIYPRTTGGLVGIVLGPLIHSNLEHLLSNSVALLILGVALFYFYPRESWQVLLYGWLLSGILTWCIARSAYHIGASSLIYLFGFYLFFRGWRVRKRALAALSLVITFLYGSMLWGIFPSDIQISWEGHLAGALAGTMLAFLQKVDSLAAKEAFGNASAYDYSARSHTGLPSWKIRYRP